MRMLKPTISVSSLHILFPRRYLPWIRQNNEFKKVLIGDLNGKEADLRGHPDFGEVFNEDLESLAEFRRTGELGELLIEDGETTYTASQRTTTQCDSTALKPRTSLGSSVSSIRSKVSALESIHEEVENGGEISDHEDDDTRQSTPSPIKRRRTLSSTHTEASASTIGASFGEDSDDSGDESTLTAKTR